jgi:hypothetical protein
MTVARSLGLGRSKARLGDGARLYAQGARFGMTRHILLWQQLFVFPAAFFWPSSRSFSSKLSSDALQELDANPFGTECSGVSCRGLPIDRTEFCTVSEL